MKIPKTPIKSLIALCLLGAGTTSCNMTDMEEVSNQRSEIYKSTGLSTSPNILYQETFEGSDPFSFAHTQFAESYAFAVTDNPVFQGTYSGRFELNDTDDMVASGTRAEVLFPEQSENERWYSYSVYIPSADYKIDSNYDIISQWHQGSGSGSPTCTFRIQNDKWQLEHGDDASRRKYYDITTVEKDRWNELVFHIIHSSGEDGLVEIWLNGSKVLSLNGGNMDKDFDLPRWKVGIYKDDWNGSETTDTKRRVLFYDNVRMGDENASFEEMSSLTTSDTTDSETDDGSTGSGVEEGTSDSSSTGDTGVETDGTDQTVDNGSSQEVEEGTSGTDPGDSNSAVAGNSGKEINGQAKGQGKNK